MTMGSTASVAWPRAFTLAPPVARPGRPAAGSTIPALADGVWSDDGRSDGRDRERRQGRAGQGIPGSKGARVWRSAKASSPPVAGCSSWCPAARTRSPSSISSRASTGRPGGPSGCARPPHQPSPSRSRERCGRGPGSAGLRGPRRRPDRSPTGPSRRPAGTSRRGRGKRAAEAALEAAAEAGVRPDRPRTHRRRSGGDHAVPAGPLRRPGRLQGHAPVRAALGASAAGVPARRDRRVLPGPRARVRPGSGQRVPRLRPHGPARRGAAGLGGGAARRGGGCGARRRRGGRDGTAC